MLQGPAGALGRNVVLVVVLLAAVTALVVGGTGCRSAGAGTQPAAEGDATILQATTANFDELVLGSDVPVLLDFTASWCPPCRAMHPNLEQLALADPGKLKVVQVDVDRNRELTARYRISSIPALFVIKGGQTVDQTVGYQSVEQLKALVGRHL